MMDKTFGQKVINFNKLLHFSGTLPDSIQIINPFKENKEVISIIESFYNKFYNDLQPRRLILSINPGRFGSGATGITFTDTKRLSKICKIPISSITTHEPSSVFIYDLIDRYGGVEKFYKDYYINSICPLGFIEQNEKDNWINRNYYDYKELYLAMEGFMIASLKQQLSFRIDKSVCFVLGKKNATYIKQINEKEKLFESILVLDHPRYIQQYKLKFRENYLENFLKQLSK